MQQIPTDLHFNISPISPDPPLIVPTIANLNLQNYFLGDAAAG